jgi:FKBP-type peptidyl-prolyl cis-trans isomerase
MLNARTFSQSTCRSAALITLISIGLVSCDQTTETTEMSLDSQEQRISYGIAMNMGRRMKAEGVPIDADAFAEGLRDALSGAEAKMSDDEINAEMMAMQEQMQAEQEAEMQAASNVNLEAGRAYLAENAGAEGVQTTDSGLQYRVLRAGSGAKPTSADSVEVHYEGRLINGSVFDSSYSRGEPVTFGVTQVIPGWTEALQLMSEGAEYELTIPSELAYGAGGAGGAIGPNEVLIFKVELLSVDSAES